MPSFPMLNQELTFAPDATTSGSIAPLPDSIRGQYVEMTIYVEYGAGTSAGKVQPQTSHRHDIQFVPSQLYTGTWANVGSSIDWAAASTQKFASITGVFDDFQLNITTTVTGGTVRAWVVAAFSST